MHYLLHGCHHKHPMDGLRLVFPPAATAIIAVPVMIPLYLSKNMYTHTHTHPCVFYHYSDVQDRNWISQDIQWWIEVSYDCCQVWSLIKLLSTPSTAPAIFAGALLGYVMYDLTHYYLHHGQPSSSMPKRLKVINWTTPPHRRFSICVRLVTSLCDWDWENASPCCCRSTTWITITGCRTGASGSPRRCGIPCSGRSLLLHLAPGKAHDTSTKKKSHQFVIFLYLQFWPFARPISQIC